MVYILFGLSVLFKKIKNCQKEIIIKIFYFIK